MSRADSQTAIERRVRRLATRRGLSLLIAKKRTAKVEEHGGYMLRDDDTHEIVFGNRGYEYSADLDEIEVFLTGDEDEEE